ncbi:MAG TPA: 2-C-methyl-D-erythritol 4-phosphate cytidylyltransferase [Dissulfurispiraceae bacterium]|nr:2-C-methyl-D-erythritol 4-phosphate cytidylyltransferase [Dissulfurispiraceae bacterium]
MKNSKNRMTDAPHRRTVAVVAAAGMGKRFGGFMNKQYVELAGRPVLFWSLSALQACDLIDEIIPVVQEQEFAATTALIDRYGIGKVMRIVPGGKERQDSVMNGLASLPECAGIVVVHDGARPLIAPETIAAAIHALDGFDGAVVAVPVKDTVKEAIHEADRQRVTQTLDRSRLWAIQTPQVFYCETLKTALERARREGFFGMDDAAVVERYGGSVIIVKGSYRNIKITTPEDLLIAEAFLKSPEGGSSA